MDFPRGARVWGRAAWVAAVIAAAALGCDGLGGRSAPEQRQAAFLKAPAVRVAAPIAAAAAPDTPPRKEAKAELLGLLSEHSASGLHAEATAALGNDQVGEVYGVGGLATVGRGSGGGAVAASRSGSRRSGEQGKMAKKSPGAGLYGLAAPMPGALAARSSTVAAAAPAPAPAPRLDPNARYATTYRPGAAALAGFDAALARGAIPRVYRDLVGDFGARYAPELAAPASGALAVAVDTERAALAPAGGPLHLRVALRSAAAPNLPRARLAVSLVIDTSGSMDTGHAIDKARQAAVALVDRLDGGDLFSLVTFDSDARVLVSAGPIGPRRAAVRKQIAANMAAAGGTNLSAGLDAGYALALAPNVPADTVRIVMLLSDGQANAGDTNPESLAERSARAFQDGVQTSTFGLGDSFDGPLLSALADRGAGGNYYLADPADIAPAFARELDARLVPAALAVELRVRLRPDVVPTTVYGSRQLDAREAAGVRAQEVSADQQAARRNHIARDRQHDAEGGMRFFIPSFARDDRHALLLALELPAGTSERAIGSVEIRYKDRLLGRNVTQELPVRIRYARSEVESAATANPGVLRTVQAFAAGDTILAAAARVDGGDRAGAARLLGERAEVLKAAARKLGEPRLAEEGQRLARLSGAVGGVRDLLALSVLLRGSGAGYLQ